MAYPESAEFRLRGRARISAHVIWDHLCRPPARKPSDVPWCGEAITPGWLTPVLCRDTPGAEVVAVEVEGGSSGSSVRRRIKVTYDEAGRRAGLVEHFFAKTTPTVLTRMTSGMAAMQEGTFFRALRPELPFEAPTLRLSVQDTNSGRSFHMFEDLTVTKGAHFCTYATAVDREQVEQAVDLLAYLHGRYHDSDRLRSDLTWIPPYEAFFSAMEHNGVHAGHEQAGREAADVIPAGVRARWSEVWPMALAGLKAHTEEPRTIIHSDVHLGNWYVTAAGRMGLCDWQCISTGHWARDLAYAIGTIPEVDQRRAWERDLIGRYLDRMHAQGGPKVPFDHAFTRYRQQMFAALLMWTPTLCHPPTMPDMQPEAMSMLMIRRLATAIADLDAFASQPAA